MPIRTSKRYFGTRLLLSFASVACSSDFEGGTSSIGTDGGSTGGSETGGISGSSGTGTSGGAATGGRNGTGGHVGGSGGVAGRGVGGSGNAATGGTGNAAGNGGVPAQTGGTAGTGGATDSGLPNACPGVTPLSPGTQTCRSAADCFGGAFCAHDYVGGCPSTQHQCSADSDCIGGNAICLDGPCGTLCVAACTNTSCAADQVCAANGHCVPKLCTAGYTCPTDALCAPTNPAADANGCVPKSCSTDGYVCPADFTCAPSSNADPHGCVAISCDAGYACPLNFDCVPSSSDLHHCQKRSCTTDAKCDCGACVFGRCEDRLFWCSYPPVCASPDTPIATEDGNRAIVALRVGDLVYSVDHGRVVAVPIIEVHRTSVTHHRVVRLELESGAVLDISGLHPTADGRKFSDLRSGDALGGVRIRSARVVPYAAAYTYDILPASDSGTYFAGGVLIGSTLGGAALSSRGTDYSAMSLPGAPP